jgi:hypothetical protein
LPHTTALLQPSANACGALATAPTPASATAVDVNAAVTNFLMIVLLTTPLGTTPSQCA